MTPAGSQMGSIMMGLFLTLHAGLRGAFDGHGGSDAEALGIEFCMLDSRGMLMQGDIKGAEQGEKCAYSQDM
jgi:hypothetical protein